MDTGQVALDSSMAMIVRQLQTTTEMQVAVMKKIVENQQQMAEMLASIGVGQNVDVTTRNCSFTNGYFTQSLCQTQIIILGIV